MNQATTGIIRAVLSNKIRDLLVEMNRPAQTTPQAAANLVNDLDAYSAALVDFARSGQTADEAAVTALDVIMDGAGQLAELDAYFDKGTGKGSTMHKFIRRLRTVADSQLPVIQDAAE